MAFTKITAADRIGKGNVGQPDTPGLTTAEMQELMDSLPNLAIDKFNNHIDELAMESAATNIGATPPSGILANRNIQSILNTMAYQLIIAEGNSHSHFNMDTLNEISAEFKTDVDALLALLANINSVATVISNASTDSELATAKAVVDYIGTAILDRAVTSFNNRSGDVFPRRGDYLAGDILYGDSDVETKLDDIHDMTGATDNADGSHGLVPKPNAGDQNKILYGSGQWGDPPINYLSGLDDVSITSLQDNQSLVYSATLQKWINRYLKEIVSIEKTSTVGLIDIYTITYIDGSTSTFQVRNGKSAYQYAVEGGYENSEERFYEDLGEVDTLVEDASASALSAEASALLSESWAVGQKNGVDVPDTDDTWHNNSKYYAGIASEDAATATAALQSIVNYVALMHALFGAIGIGTQSGDSLVTQNGDRLIISY